MGTRNGAMARAVRLARADETRIRQEVALGRRIAGLSQSQLGKPCGMSRTQVARIEAGTRAATIGELACLGAGVGLDVRLRAFPGGDPIRDAGQQRKLARLRLRCDPLLRWRTEVPLPIEGDRRAWDAVIDGPTWRAMVEVETVVEDVQALERRVALKVRDGRAERFLLVIADTRRNRRGLEAAPHAFAEFDRDARGTLRRRGLEAAPHAFAEFDRDARGTLRRLARAAEPPTRALIFL